MATQLEINLTKIQSQLTIANKQVTAMLSQKSYDAPKYTELQYIQFSGGQWIDTLYPLWQSTYWAVEVDFSISKKYDYQHFFSISDSDTTNETWAAADGAYYIRVGGLSKTKITTLSTDTRYTIKHRNYSKFESYVNNQLVSSLNQAVTSSTLNLRFGKREKGAFVGNLYALRLYDSNNNLVRSLIPVIRNSDNVVCMFDLITNEFYLNKGTGSFTAGGVL